MLRESVNQPLNPFTEEDGRRGIGLVETILILLIVLVIGQSFFPIYHESKFCFEGKTLVIRINRITGTVAVLKNEQWERIATEGTGGYRKKIRIPPSFFNSRAGKDPAAVPPGHDHEARPEKETFYTIQISSIRNVPIAVEYMKQLRGRGLDIHWDRWTSPSGKSWIRLFSGRYRSFGEAENALEEENRRHDHPGSFTLRLPRKTWVETDALLSGKENDKAPETMTDGPSPAETAMGNRLREQGGIPP